MLTRKHFEETAKIINEGVLAAEHQRYPLQAKLTLHRTALQFALWFSVENPNFDQNRFIKACGLDYRA